MILSVSRRLNAISLISISFANSVPLLLIALISSHLWGPRADPLLSGKAVLLGAPEFFKIIMLLLLSSSLSTMELLGFLQMFMPLALQ